MIEQCKNREHKDRLSFWMPFGKIFHVVTSLIVRVRTGAAFSRRGVRA